MSNPLDGWTFAQSGHDWIGSNTTSNRRTACKGTEQQAMNDAKAGRYVCRQWPDCPHRDPDECTRAIKAQKKYKS